MSAHLTNNRTARGLVDLAGGRHRCYVNGSLRILITGWMQWEEKCHSGCDSPARHGCVSEHSAQIPSGRWDTDWHGPR